VLEPGLDVGGTAVADGQSVVPADGSPVATSSVAPGVTAPLGVGVGVAQSVADPDGEELLSLGDVLPSLLLGPLRSGLGEGAGVVNTGGGTMWSWRTLWPTCRSIQVLSTMLMIVMLVITWGAGVTTTT
jgi:hypothetical protein